MICKNCDRLIEFDEDIQNYIHQDSHGLRCDYGVVRKSDKDIYADPIVPKAG